MSVEFTIETADKTIVLEMQDHVPPVITIDNIPELRDELDSKVDKEVGKSLVSDAEIEKLSTVEQYATANRPDSENADKIHEHVIADVAGLDDALADKVDAAAGLGLSELSFTAADKSSLEQSVQDRHTHNNKTVIDDLSDDSGVLQYKGLPISDQVALDAKVDKVEGKSLVNDAEIAKLVTVQENATANRADSLNADKAHSHEIADIDTLTAKLELINQWLQVPADKKYFDFVGNLYGADGMPATVSSLSTFTRPSTATQWKDGALVDVAANVMRIDAGRGLFLERAATELIPNNTSFNSTDSSWIGKREPDGSLKLTSGGDTHIITTNIPLYPNGNTEPSSGYYWRGVLVKKGAGYIYMSTASSAITLVVNISNGVVEFVGKDTTQHKVDDLGDYWGIYCTSLASTQARRSFTIGASDTFTSVYTPVAPSSGFSVTIAYPSFRDSSRLTQTLIKTSGTPATRTKETLVVPFETGQTVTHDMDAGVRMTITGLNAVFEGHGYIRNVRVN